MGTKIVTDSTADIPQYLIEKYGIIELPLTVHFGDQEFRDRIDMTPDEFYERLSAAISLPTTSQVNPSAFQDVFKNIVDSGDSVVSIHLSSDLSGTYQSACIAKNTIGSDKISVIDSRTATIALGMIVIKAAELTENGIKHQEIVEAIENYKNNIKLLVVVDTLEYLRKGGRLSGAKAIIGSMFNVKPILTVEDGKVKMQDKARGNKKALNTVIDIAVKKMRIPVDYKIGIADAKNKAAADELKSALSKKFGNVEFVETEVGCVIATHAGPGAFGLAYEI